jgi:hypothetical protein
MSVPGVVAAALALAPPGCGEPAGTTPKSPGPSDIDTGTVAAKQVVLKVTGMT